LPVRLHHPDRLEVVASSLSVAFRGWLPRVCRLPSAGGCLESVGCLPRVVRVCLDATRGWLEAAVRAAAVMPPDRRLIALVRFIRRRSCLQTGGLLPWYALFGGGDASRQEAYCPGTLYSAAVMPPDRLWMPPEGGQGTAAAALLLGRLNTLTRPCSLAASGLTGPCLEAR
jgi:hypothetical protein